MGGSADELRKILAPGSCADLPLRFQLSPQLFPELPELLLIQHVLLGLKVDLLRDTVNSWKTAVEAAKTGVNQTR